MEVKISLDDDSALPKIKWMPHGGDKYAGGMGWEFSSVRKASNEMPYHSPKNALTFSSFNWKLYRESYN